MKRVDEAKQELIQAIVESNEYKEYMKYKEEIGKNPDLKRAVDEYRRRNFELQYDENVPDMLAASENLRNEYKDVRGQEIAHMFLDSEMCLCREIQDICHSVVEAVDFDMDFLQ